MTLIGLNSSSGDFDNLTLAVGKGTKLTLQDVRITGDRTLLSLAGGNTLTLLGENRLIGCADASGNACPTVISGGDLTICGSGSLALQALVNNAAFMGAEKSKLSIEDCTISVFKSDKLGFDGGAFCANGAELTMTNAAFLGRTDSGGVAGTGAGMFSPDRPVTKEQAAALLVRFARMQGVSIPADAAPVYVAECSAWAQTDVQAAYAAGLLDRFSACLAAPQEAASRAERKGISRTFFPVSRPFGRETFFLRFSLKSGNKTNIVGRGGAPRPYQLRLNFTGFRVNLMRYCL